MEGKNNRQELHSTLAHLALSIQKPSGLSSISWGHVTLLNVAKKKQKINKPTLHLRHIATK